MATSVTSPVVTISYATCDDTLAGDYGIRIMASLDTGESDDSYIFWFRVYSYVAPTVVD